MRALATLRGRLPLAFLLGAAACGPVATSDSSELGLASLEDLARPPPPDLAQTPPDFWSWDASECDWSRCVTNFQGIYCMVTMPCDGIDVEAPDVASAQAVMAVAPDFTCYPVLAGRYRCYAKNGYISPNVMWQICRITALPFFPIVDCVQA